MHKEILTKEQHDLLPLVAQFRKTYYLAGGTAIALHIGHRRSIDFDLFSHADIKRNRIKQIIEKHGFTTKEVLYEAFDQLHIVVNGVKMTFFHFPYDIPAQANFDDVIKLPTLRVLAAMKAHALGGRAKWKDYVDLYFLLKSHFDLKEISHEAKQVFGNYFNEKLFREQLAYYEDIDYREKIEFIDKEIDEKEIKAFLSEMAVGTF